jgi:methyl-accepting chemotaxis protein
VKTETVVKLAWKLREKLVVMILVLSILPLMIAIVPVIVIVTGGIISQRLAGKVKEISNNMEDISEGEGDLTLKLPIITRDELGELAHWFNNFMENLEDVIIKAKQAANQVDAATLEVAAGARGPLQTSQEQASAVEEVAATIEEMTSAIKQNASNAETAREKAKGMVNTAKKTSEAAQALVKVMNEMSTASKKIGDITVMVNEVAFQEDTVNKISAGDAMVKWSGESIIEIIVHIDELSQAMEDIAASSAEQSSGVDELNRAIAQMDPTTQQNASTVEQLSGTADNLSTEARDLTVTVEWFRVSGEETKKAKRTLVKKPVTPAKPVRPAPGQPDPPRPMPARSAYSRVDEYF